MRILKTLTILIILLCFACKQSNERRVSDSAVKADTIEAFKNRILTSLQNKDRDAFVTLYNNVGVDEQIKGLWIAHFNELLKSNITKIETAELDDKYKSEFVTDEGRYKANLQALGYIRIEYMQQTSDKSVSVIQIPYGKKEDRYLLVGINKDSLQVNGIKPSTLGISIYSEGDTEISINGYCDYVESNKLVRRQISGTTPQNIGFWGNSIKNCEISNNSKKGKIKLVILVDGKTEYESEYTEYPNEIRYSQK